MTAPDPLHVTVFGATGGIGRHVVDQLLAAGHTVSAYARTPAKLDITSPNLTVAKGSVRSGFLGRDKVGSAMTRADIAAFLVAQLTDDTYRNAAPAISN